MWNQLVIPASGVLEGLELTAATYTTNPVALLDGMTTHAFQYKLAASGAPTLTVTPYTSITQQIWISNGIKLNAATKTSGPDGDGMDTIPLSLKPGEFVRFEIVVADATGNVTLEFVQK